MVVYQYSFIFDPTKHKSFSLPSRHVQHQSHALFPALVLSKEQAALLRLGLAAFDMDYKWMGNLTDSKANAKQGEVVVRLYRTWGSHLIYEARYRPVGPSHILTLYEFAYETDAKIYNGQPYLAGEVESFRDILGGVLDVIMDRIKASS